MSTANRLGKKMGGKDQNMEPKEAKRVGIADIKELEIMFTVKR
jgi:hypothetical protein